MLLKVPKLVLIIMRVQSTRTALRRQLEAHHLNVVEASTLHDGLQAFLQYHADLDGVVIEDCIEDTQNLDSLNLIATIASSGFPNPIIAISSFPSHLAQMSIVGASHEVEMPFIGEPILRILGIKPKP
jgi:CheY-like chemotaxis protein